MQGSSFLLLWELNIRTCFHLKGVPVRTTTATANPAHEDESYRASQNRITWAEGSCCMHKNIYIRAFVDMVIGFENGCVVWGFFVNDEDQGYRKGSGQRYPCRGHRNNVGRHNLPYSMHSFEQLKWGQIRILQVLEPVRRCRWPLVAKQSSTTPMKAGNAYENSL